MTEAPPYLKVVRLPVGDARPARAARKARATGICPVCKHLPFVPRARVEEMLLEHLTAALDSKTASYEAKSFAGELYAKLLLEHRAGLCGLPECAASAVAAFAVLLAGRRLAEVGNV